MDIYLYVLAPEVEKVIHTITIISTILSATFIVYRYTIDFSKMQNELRYLANTEALIQLDIDHFK